MSVDVGLLRMIQTLPTDFSCLGLVGGGGGGGGELARFHSFDICFDSIS